MEFRVAGFRPAGLCQCSVVGSRIPGFRRFRVVKETIKAAVLALSILLLTVKSGVVWLASHRSC